MRIPKRSDLWIFLEEDPKVFFSFDVRDVPKQVMPDKPKRGHSLFMPGHGLSADVFETHRSVIVRIRKPAPTNDARRTRTNRKNQCSP